MRDGVCVCVCVGGGWCHGLVCVGGGGGGIGVGVPVRLSRPLCGGRGVDAVLALCFCESFAVAGGRGGKPSPGVYFGHIPV